ncbi:MAG: hypothetical protein L0Y72_23585 [Gemmataceae bacterium]|nr:hypothetical protein [Gemmataceae bacterium]MCI0742027.1 hypothetical protein [Gemmataceae bacterium]
MQATKKQRLRARIIASYPQALMIERLQRASIGDLQAFATLYGIVEVPGGQRATADVPLPAIQLILRRLERELPKRRAAA